MILIGSTVSKAAEGVLLPDVPKITRRSIGTLCGEKHAAKGATLELDMIKPQVWVLIQSFVVARKALAHLPATHLLPLRKFGVYLLDRKRQF